MTRHWMYNVNRRSKEFIDGVHYFLRVAEENKRDGFICCPCAMYQNLKEYSSSTNIHSYFLKSGFMPNYIYWTKHGESRIIMDECEEEEEEEELDHANIIAQYGGYNDVAVGGDNEEEVATEDDWGDDAFGDAIRDAQRECESEK